MKRQSILRWLLPAMLLALAIPAVQLAALDEAEQIPFDPNFHIYLLIGQSNMEGAPKPEDLDLEANPRIKVLAYTNSPRQKRKYNNWYVATPPLHSPYTGVGPGDWFAKTLIKSMPDNVTIGLVPCGINGVDIDFFRKNVVSKRRKEFQIPPDNKWKGAYEWVLSRAQLAQKSGVIKGILFHQGESDNGQEEWLKKLKEMTNDLRKDLNAPDIPILVGDLLWGGGSEPHHQVVERVPPRIKNSRVISSKGLTGTDRFHFDLASQRELGKRYAEAMLEFLK